MRMGPLSSEGGGAESFRIPEENEEDRKSGEDTLPLPNRTATEDVALIRFKGNNPLKDKVASTFNTDRK